MSLMTTICLKILAISYEYNEVIDAVIWRSALQPLCSGVTKGPADPAVQGGAVSGGRPNRRLNVGQFRKRN